MSEKIESAFNLSPPTKAWRGWRVELSRFIDLIRFGFWSRLEWVAWRLTRHWFWRDNWHLRWHYFVWIYFAAERFGAETARDYKARGLPWPPPNPEVKR